MACRISKKCVNCDMCEADCPQGAISFDGTTYKIDESLCNECEGVYPSPQCIQVCPIQCIQRLSECQNNQKKSNLTKENNLDFYKTK